MRDKEEDGYRKGSAGEVLLAATKLGLTSFGGPVAHIGYFREEYVVRRKWLDDNSYADLVALCQFLPGPASSQVGISLGIIRAGLPGGVAAWIGFTLPSALMMIAFAYGMQLFGAENAGWLHGLKVAAVAVVAQALWGMGRTLAADRERATIAILSAIAVIAWPGAFVQMSVIGVAGLVGWIVFRGIEPDAGFALKVPISRRVATISLVIFVIMLIGLPVVRQLNSDHTLEVFDSFFRVGSMVFGGGHVVLPLLEKEVVPSGWVSSQDFVAGYGAAQAVPGPLFTFSAYLGAIMGQEPNGWLGGVIALAAIFLPSFLLIIGTLPFWDTLRSQGPFQAAMRGVNASVVGLLLAALYNPVWTSAIHSAADFGLAIAAFGLLALWKAPPWLVVLFAALGGEFVQAMQERF